MLGQIVEIEGEGRRLSLERGFLAVAGPDGPLGAVPLDDIEAVILSNPAASLTSQAISALAARGMEAQAAAALPVKKRLWSEIVRAKIRAQAAALERHAINPHPVRVLADQVRSGDPENLEARAAQRYFPALFGSEFVRARGGGPNAFLNYGYTVLRAATARAIVAAGLHPSLSLHHRSKGDGLRLADDLMEPFRPTVDLAAKALLAEGIQEIDTSAKRRLAQVLHADFKTDDGVTILSNALGRLAVSLAQVFTRERKSLALPLSRIPVLASEVIELRGETDELE